MQATRSITLDVSQNYLLSPIFAKQVDDGTRFLKIQLTDNGTPIQPESGCIAHFRGIKPDQHSFDNTATINSDGTITVELTEQVLACAGIVRCDVAIVKDEKTLASVNFAIDVQEIPLNANQEISSNEFTYLQYQIKSSEAWAHGRSDFPERAEDNAKYWAEQAAASTGDIEDIKDEAVAARNDAVDAKNAAVSARDTAVSAKNDAVTAKTDAVTAKNAAVTARTAAEVSRDEAEAYAHGKSGYPAMDQDNAKYWNQQTEALALDLSIVNGELCITYNE